MTAYYNENDPKAAAWLRELIKQGHIADGEVDERDIRDVRPVELTGYTQCHFFAGIGVWSYALRQAGWSDDRPIWTGSCPCQPFSTAGAGIGFDDERHLWPHWHHLIRHGKPEGVPIFGEQVAAKSALPWLDLVQSDMEAENHAVWAYDICAAGFGAPNIRQRLFWAAHPNGLRCEGVSREGKKGTSEHSEVGGVANTDSGQRQRITDGEGRQRHRQTSGRQQGNSEFAAGGEFLRMANTKSERSDRRKAAPKPEGRQSPKADGEIIGVASTDSNGREQEGGRVTTQERDGIDGNPALFEGQPSAGPVNGHWRNSDWLYCRDDKFRPVESGTSPLVDGAAARVVRLRGYGNAINAEVAKAFIESYIEVMGELNNDF